MSAEIECTPSTRKSHGGTSRPSSSANGSTNPPMHASTWQLASTVAASAAISGIGSTTPCGYCGAEPTTSTVFGPTAAAMASTSAVQSSRTGVVTTRMPNRWADLWNAAWALSARTISGAVTPRSMRPRSRAARTAHWIDSVPPLVRNPARRRRAVQELGRPADDLGLDPAERRERRRVERVLVEEHRRRLLGDVVDRRAAVVDQAERAARRPTARRRPAGPAARR